MRPSIYYDISSASATRMLVLADETDELAFYWQNQWKTCTIYLMLLSISAIPQLRNTHSAKQTTFPLRKSQKIFPFNECMTEPGSYFMPIWTCIFCSQLLSNHWQADEELKDAVEGLNPDAEKHESYIDIEPVSIKIPWAQSPNLRILTHFTYDLQVTGMTLGVKAGLQ